MPENRTVEFDGKTVRVLVGGGGPPLVYLHSLGADVDWLDAHERLGSRFTVYLPAHPGFAESTGLERIDDVLDLALHYVDLLDALDLPRPHLIGTSLGGWVAAELASLWPDRVAKLVLTDAVGLWLDEAPTGELFGSTPQELAKMLFHDQTHPIPALMAMITSPADLPESIVLPQLKAMEAGARIGWNPYLPDPKLPARLRRVKAPTLIVWGRQDGLVPVAHGEAYARLIPKAQLRIIEACGHLPPIERPDAWAELVGAFLA
jgi:pimeloyl-ACP methyl ester carboxylesterase